MDWYNILIIYANDHQDLSMLEKEAKEISRLLDRGHNKKYTVKILPVVSSQELIDELAHNGDEFQRLVAPLYARRGLPLEIPSKVRLPITCVKFLKMVICFII